jgi:sulfonate transport system substrate-binding protein
MNPSSSRRQLLIPSLALATLVAGAWLWQSRAQNRDTASNIVRIGSFSTAVDYAPYLVAKEKGWFDEALRASNSRAEYTTFQTLAPINESLAAGRVDVVFEAEPPAIIGKAAGVDVKIAGISTSLTQTILVPTTGGASTITDLRGKKIAVLAGTSSHYGVFKILEKAGLQKGDVQIVDMAPAEAKAAFESGRVDAWAVWPPFVEQQVLAGRGVALGAGEASINSIVAMRGGFVRENQAQAKSIVQTVERAKTWILDNPVEAQAIVAKQTDTPLPVIEKAWPVHNWSATLSEAVQDDIQSKADFLHDNGSIKSRLNVRADLIDLSLLP